MRCLVCCGTHYSDEDVEDRLGARLEKERLAATGTLRRFEKGKISCVASCRPYLVLTLYPLLSYSDVERLQRSSRA